MDLATTEPYSQKAIQWVTEMSSFPQNPDPARNRHCTLWCTSFGWAQQQAQHSSLGPASSPAVCPFSIRPLMLRPARAQQPHFKPRISPARVRRPAWCGARGLELDISSRCRYLTMGSGPPGLASVLCEHRSLVARFSSQVQCKDILISHSHP